MSEVQHTVVLPRKGVAAGPQDREFIVYGAEPDDHSVIPRRLLMGWDDYLDLGQPDHVTVTVRPGDLLNEGHKFVPAWGTETNWCQTCHEHKSQH